MFTSKYIDLTKKIIFKVDEYNLDLNEINFQNLEHHIIERQADYIQFGTLEELDIKAIKAIEQFKENGAFILYGNPGCVLIKTKILIGLVTKLESKTLSLADLAKVILHKRPCGIVTLNAECLASKENSINKNSTNNYSFKALDTEFSCIEKCGTEMLKRRNNHHLANGIIERAVANFNSAKFAESLILLDEAIDLEPNMSGLFLVKAVCEANLSKTTDSLRSVTIFMNSNPDNEQGKTLFNHLKLEGNL